MVSKDEAVLKVFEDSALFFETLAGASKLTVQKDKDGIPEDAVSVVTAAVTVYIPLGEFIDISKELDRLKKEEKRLEGELNRSRGMLSNEKFLSKAPAKKIEEEKEKLAGYEKMMEQVKERLSQLGN